MANVDPQVAAGRSWGKVNAVNREMSVASTVQGKFRANEGLDRLGYPYHYEAGGDSVPPTQASKRSRTEMDSPAGERDVGGDSAPPTQASKRSRAEMDSTAGERDVTMGPYLAWGRWRRGELDLQSGFPKAIAGIRFITYGVKHVVMELGLDPRHGVARALNLHAYQGPVDDRLAQQVLQLGNVCRPQKFAPLLKKYTRARLEGPLSSNEAVLKKRALPVAADFLPRPPLKKHTRRLEARSFPTTPFKKKNAPLRSHGFAALSLKNTRARPETQNCPTAPFR